MMQRTDCKKTYPRVNITPPQERHMQYFYITFTNFKPTERLSLPQNKHGHFYITLGVVSDLNKPPIPLTGVGKVMATNSFSHRWYCHPKANGYIEGISSLFKTLYGVIKDEEFPYDQQHQNQYRHFKTVSKANSSQQSQSLSGLPRAKKSSKRRSLRYDAYLLTAEEYKKIVNFLKHRYKEQRISGQPTTMQYEVNVAEWIEDEQCLRNTHFSSTLKLIVDTVLLSQRSYQKHKLDKKTVRNDHLNLVTIVSGLQNISRVSEYTDCLFFLHLQIHFLTLADLSSSQEDFSDQTVWFSDDLDYVKQTIIDVAAPLFRDLDEALSKFDDAEDAQNQLDQLNKLLKSPDSSASALAEQCAQVHQVLNHLCDAAAPKHQFIVDTLTEPKAVQNVERIKFSYLGNSCYSWTLDFMKQHVPGFNSEPYDGQYHAQLPHVSTHQHGIIDNPLIFTPRQLDSVLKNDANHYHYLAAEILYKQLWPKSKSPSVYKTWFPVYQALEREVRFKRGSLDTLRTVQDILDEYAARDTLPLNQNNLYRSLFKLAKQENDWRAYYSIRNVLSEKLATKSVKDTSILLYAADQLALEEPEKLSMVMTVLENLVSLSDNPFDLNYAHDINQILASVPYQTPLWTQFELATSVTLLVFSVTAVLITATTMPPIAIAALVSSVLWGLHGAVKTINMLQVYRSDLRKSEDEFVDKVEQLTSDLTFGLTH